MRILATLILAVLQASPMVTVTPTAVTVRLPSGQEVRLQGVEPIIADYCVGVIEKALSPLIVGRASD